MKSYEKIDKDIITSVYELQFTLKVPTLIHNLQEPMLKLKCVKGICSSTCKITIVGKNISELQDDDRRHNLLNNLNNDSNLLKYRIVSVRYFIS